VDERDEKPESLDRFWDAELEILEEFLDQLWDDGAMDLEELDGFFAALHCSPEQVLPGEYLPEIVGDVLADEELFPNQEAVQIFLQLIAHHWNEVGNAFRAEDFFIPLLLEDEDEKVSGNHWAIGFLRGVDMRKDAWQEILQDEEHKAGWCVPIFALAHEFDPDPEMRPYKEQMTDERREHLLMGIAGAVTEMFGYFAPHRARNASGFAASASSLKQKKKKFGRNDPCYCGSGKKYKKCCGAGRVN
jgi:uncharacterized protein